MGWRERRATKGWSKWKPTKGWYERRPTKEAAKYEVLLPERSLAKFSRQNPELCAKSKTDHGSVICLEFLGKLDLINTKLKKK